MEQVRYTRRRLDIQEEGLIYKEKVKYTRRRLSIQGVG